MAYNRADGLLSDSAALLLDVSVLAAPARMVDVILSNTDAGDETVDLYVSVLGGTQRRIAHVEMATDETTLIAGIYLDSGDRLYGAATDPDVVSYVVQPAQGRLALATVAADGGEKVSGGGSGAWGDAWGS